MLTLNLYVDHISDTVNTTQGINCKCPKPCNQSIYDPVLSYAQLSTRNVDNILVNNYGPLKKSYGKALETSQRLNWKVLFNDISLYQSLDNKLDKLIEMAVVGVGSTESLVSLWLECSRAFVTEIIAKDIKQQFSGLDAYLEVLSGTVSGSINVHTHYKSKLEMQLQELSVIATTQISSSSTLLELVISLLDDMIKTSEIQTTLTQHLHHIFEAPENFTARFPVKYTDLPLQFFVDTNACDIINQKYIESLTNVTVILNKYKSKHEYSTSFSIEDGIELALYINTMRLPLVAHGQNETACFTEYLDLLSEINSWLDGMDADIMKIAEEDNSIKYFVDNVEGYTQVVADKHAILSGVAQYKHGLIGKEELLRITFPINDPVKLFTHISHLTSSVKENYINAAKEYNKEVRRFSKKTYIDLFSYTNEMAHYMSNTAMRELSGRYFNYLLLY